MVVPKQISNPEVRGDSESESEENENENRRKQRSLFHEKANTKLCKCSFCTRFCSWSMGHGSYEDTIMILKNDRSALAVPDDARLTIEPFQALKRGREAFNYLLGR